MTKDNKTLFLIIALSTLFIGTTLSVIIYLVFGEATAYFFVIFFATPIGVVCSLLFLMLYNAMRSDRG